MTSLLIGDIRVPAAASYPQFRSLFFLIYSLFLLPLSFLLSLSLSLGSALISRRLQTPPPHPPSFAFQVPPLHRSSPTFLSGRETERDREGGRRRRRRDGGAGATVDASSRAPHPDIWGRLFSHEHQCVINRINLGPNFLMIAVLMYVNECSLLTHYRQFARDTHNQTPEQPTNIYFC